MTETTQPTDYARQDLVEEIAELIVNSEPWKYPDGSSQIVWEDMFPAAEKVADLIAACVAEAKAEAEAETSRQYHEQVVALEAELEDALYELGIEYKPRNRAGSDLSGSSTTETP